MTSTLCYIRAIDDELKKLEKIPKKQGFKKQKVEERIALLKERREDMVKEILAWVTDNEENLAPQFIDIVNGYYIKGKYTQSHYVKSGNFAKIVNENCLKFLST